jgi:GrpB-like predicted nucleotidyltransferase (UPF0157 family)
MRSFWTSRVPKCRYRHGVDSLIEAGLGLDYNEIRLHRTTEAWLSAGKRLRDEVAKTLIGVDVDVEPIGSSSVFGLLAKPIVDLAVGLRIVEVLPVVTRRLETAGWIYRGDAGEDGGHVFVLEARPWYRVAHLHAVERQGRQWQHYVRFRDLLRESPSARASYEAVKSQLADQERFDRQAYTQGKTDVVLSLLNEGA